MVEVGGGHDLWRSSCPNLPSELVLSSWGSLQHSVHSGGCSDPLHLVAADVKRQRIIPPPPLISKTGREGGRTAMSPAFSLACLGRWC